MGPIVTKKEVKVEIHQPPHPGQQHKRSAPPNTGQSDGATLDTRYHHDIITSTPLQKNPISDKQHGEDQRGNLATGPTGLINDTNVVTKMLLEQHVRSSLPKRTLQPFTNDPLQFTSFISNFEYTIEGKGTSDRDCLLFLEQFTRGEANSLVRSCLQMKDGRGYQEAKKLLQKRFGNVHRIAEAYLSKMRAWPNVKNDDSLGLQELSLFLLECKNTMESLDYTSELHSTANIRLLVEKLPYKMRDRWRQKADYIEEDLGRPVRFDDFSVFIEKQARIQNNAAFGKISGDKQGTGSSKGTNNKPKLKNSFATNVEEAQSNEQLQCSYCKLENHKVETCYKLQKQTIEERLKHLRQLGVCFGCLKKASHRSKDCTKKLICSKCSKKHPTVLHLDDKENKAVPSVAAVTQKTEGDKNKNQAASDVKVKSMSTCARSSAGDGSSPCIIPVKVHAKNTGITVETLAYLDTGSDATFCTNTLKEQLNVKGKSTRIEIQTITNERSVPTTVLQGLEVCDMDQVNSIALPKVYTQEEIPADKADVVTQQHVSGWQYLEDVQISQLEDKDNAHIGLLIGNNVPQAFEPWRVINSQDGGPYACKSLLGWSVHGINKKPSSPFRITRTRVEENLDQQLEKLYNYDFTERIIEDKPEKSLKDKKFLADVSESIKFAHGHYEIGLPLKDKAIQFPNNKSQAQQRAAHLKAKFRRNTKFYEDYNIFMNDTISKNYAMRVPEEEIVGPEGRTWYIPHHGVYHPRKHKLRVVFDCGANYKGASLNNELNQGPDLTNSLIGVIMRFRQDNVALMADIEGMFQQVRVPVEETDLQRFLWWKDGDIDGPLVEYRMGVHIFGATSSPACANYALRRAAEDGSTKYGAEVVNTVYNNFYMDDLLKSVAGEPEAIKLANNLRKICHEGGFKLNKWVSNSRNVLQSIPEEDRSKEVKVIDLDKDNLPSDRALGILWSPQSDRFGFQISVKERPATRRGILSVVSSVYDPLGFIAPATLPVKWIMQDLCRLKLGWDDEIPANHGRRWVQWIEELPKLQNYSVNRCFTPTSFGESIQTQLHHFSDASEKGYGTASYMRTKNARGDVHCSLVMAKSRVAPLKQTSIPRLELGAATVAVRVNHMIQQELEIPVHNTYYWTDSKSVLRYIKNESTRFHTFVANRVAVIRDGSSHSQWRYVDTANNPADDSSRGLTIDSLLKSKRWLRGPEFLWKPEEEWPDSQEQVDHQLPADDIEVKGIITNTMKTEEKIGAVDKLLNQYSSWFRLKKAVAWFLKFKDYLQFKSKQQISLGSTLQEESDDKDSQTKSMPSSKLQISDMQRSEMAIIQYIQRKSFPEEVEILQKHPVGTSKTKADRVTKYVKKSSQLYKLNPFMQDGVLKVGGRVSQSSLPEETKHQVILPKDSNITEMILREVHENTGHSGRNHILAHLYRKYWVIHANALSRRIVHQCVKCRKQQAKVGQQQMADLPPDRITEGNPPFTSTGVDYFGPFLVKRGRSVVKRYGVLFTCMATRAIHLEKADELTTDSCINAIRRFIARRGQVQEIRSDNGTNFVGAEKELRQEIQKWNQVKFQNELLQKNVQWKFNPPGGSHFGGAWERQIRTVRKIMSALVKEQVLTDEGLSTLFCEIEAIVNGRPITRVSGDAGDLEPLTPNHLLLLKANPNLPPCVAEKSEPYARKRWKQIQYLANVFWKRWTREYLVQLQERQKWLRPKENTKIGDIVLVVDGSRPRNVWPMGRVTATMPDKNGLVRQAVIKTKSSTLVRPVSKLCLLLEAEYSEQVPDEPRASTPAHP